MSHNPIKTKGIIKKIVQRVTIQESNNKEKSKYRKNTVIIESTISE